jgi:hypothetical protein
MPRTLRLPPLVPASRLLPGLALAGAVLAGCAAQRTITITSEPPGAQVRVDDEMIGTTPVVLPFVHYGTREILFYKEGYLTEALEFDVRAPWFSRFPADLFTEILFPIGWRDDHPVHVDLRSGADQRTRPALRSVRERAELLRRAGPDGPRPLPPSRQEEAVPSELPELEEAGAAEAATSPSNGR